MSDEEIIFFLYDFFFERYSFSALMESETYFEIIEFGLLFSAFEIELNFAKLELQMLINFELGAVDNFRNHI